MFVADMIGGWLLYVWDWHIVSFTFTAYATFNLHNLSLSPWETYTLILLSNTVFLMLFTTNSNICLMVVPIAQILFRYTIQFPSFQAEAKVTIWYHDCNLPEGMSSPYSVWSVWISVHSTYWRWHTCGPSIDLL